MVINLRVSLVLGSTLDKVVLTALQNWLGAQVSNMDSSPEGSIFFMHLSSSPDPSHLKHLRTETTKTRSSSC